MRWILATALATLALCGCAGEGSPGDDAGSRDFAVLDWSLEPYAWPDLFPIREARVPADLGPPDAGLPPDQGQPKPCRDGYEPNENCSGARSLGSINESSSYTSKTATIDPSGDADWYAVKAIEGTHACFPGTSQTYYFRARVTVPAGRKLKVCVYKDSCLASGTCAEKAGPTTIEARYKVNGRCGGNDDTSARVLVHATDASGACPPYTLGLKYDE
jgi:hypothetical protein